MITLYDLATLNEGNNVRKEKGCLVVVQTYNEITFQKHTQANRRVCVHVRTHMHTRTQLKLANSHSLSLSFSLSLYVCLSVCLSLLLFIP